MQTDQGAPRPKFALISADTDLPVLIQTGYELEFSSDFDPAQLTERDVVKVAHADGTTYNRRFNEAEFKQRNLKVIGLMTGYRWKRPISNFNQDEVLA